MRAFVRRMPQTQRRGGQSQFSPFLTAAPNEESLTARVQTHVSDHIGAALSVEAAVVNDSTMHLCRPKIPDCVPDPYVPVDDVVGKVFVLLWPHTRFHVLHRPGDFGGIPAP